MALFKDWKKLYPGSSLGDVVTDSEFYIRIGTGKNAKVEINSKGLLSEQIFGPTQNFKCACGFYTGKLHNGKVCPKCGVVCGPSSLRREVFAKIELTAPVIKVFKNKALVSLIGKSTLDMFINERYQPSRVKGDEWFLLVNKDKTALFKKSYIKTHGLPPNSTIIPIQIISPTSLYWALKFVVNHEEDFSDNILELINEALETNFIKVLPVFPPDLRPVLRKDETMNNLIVDPLSDAYRKVLMLIELFNRNEMTEFVSIQDEIFEHAESLYQQPVEEIIGSSNVELENLCTDIEDKFIQLQKRVNDVYKTVLDKVKGKEGIIRNSLISKVVEFSSRCVVTAEPEMKPWQISVPRSILYKLWKLQYLNWLKKKDIKRTIANSNMINDMTYEEDKEMFDEFLNWMMKQPLYKRLIFFNRPPTLWRHGIPAVEVLPREPGNSTVGVNLQILEGMNMDFDGDQTSMYVVHDEKALKEMEEKALYNKYVFKDQSYSFLTTLRHEMIYAAYILTEEVELAEPIAKYKRLEDVPEDPELLDEHITSTIQVGNRKTTYGRALLNKWAGFNGIVIDYTIDKSTNESLSRAIYEDCQKDSECFYKRFWRLANYLLMFITFTKHNPTVPVDEMIDMLKPEYTELFKRVPTNNIKVGYMIHDMIVDSIINKMVESGSNLSKLFKSGSRFNKVQLQRSALSIGYISDIYNNILKEPLTTNYMSGLTEEQFFKSAFGARKGIKDKSEHTPQSGYIERTLTMGLGRMQITEKDCGDNGIEITVINKRHLQMLLGKYYKLSEDDEDWSIITETDTDLIGRNIIIRSPMTCKTKRGHICHKCFGTREYSTPYIGVVAGQTVTERITQLIMRVYHTSGSAEIEIPDDLKNEIARTLVNFDKNGILLSNDANMTLLKQFSDDFQFSVEKDDDGIILRPLDLTQMKNQDTVYILEAIRSQILKKLKEPKDDIRHPVEYYQQLVELITQVGVVNSSFIEMLFANMFLVDDDVTYENLWRYNREKPIVLKLGKKGLVKFSKLLYFLYEPNRHSIEQITTLTPEDISSPHEKMVLGRLI